MKKFIITLIALFIVSISPILAQNAGKYAHINTKEVMQKIPGIDSVEIKLKAFQGSMEQMYNDLSTEYEQKKNKFDQEAGTMSASVRKYREEELQRLEQSIQEFTYNAQAEVEQEYTKLLIPFQNRLLDAINAVAKEHNYTYIFDSSTLLYSEGGEDVSALVKAKLGIK